MEKPKAITTANRALGGLWTLALTTFVVGTLYVARDVLMPLALASLLVFLLAPLVSRLERWIGRVAAVLLVVTLILGATVTGGWILTRQLVDLASRLPDYRLNIQTKLRSFQVSSGGRYSKFSAAVEELRKELPGGSGPDPVPAVAPPPADSAPPPVPPSVVPAPTPAVPAPASTRSNPFQLVSNILAPLVGPLGTAALVLLLVIFMLLKREDLRGRLLRLIGQGRISATSRAMDDAGGRITRYLLMQLVLNATYGALVALGLELIGVPNAILWGACATVLRFIPYLGPWIAATIPVTLALAVSPGWMMPLLTVALFVVLELLSNNLLEPWLYGSSTGVSPIALILSAVFWTWLWGPVGLALATPMTVCVVVLGRHIPGLSFLAVALSDEEALTPAQDCYYRLLTLGENDEMELVETYLKTHSLTELYDAVLIPVLTTIEIDHRLDLLDDARTAQVEQGLRDIVTDLGALPIALPVSRAVAVAVAASASAANATPASAPSPAGPDRVGPLVYCLPARDERDELAGAMLVQVLGRQGVQALAAPTKLDPGAVIALLRESPVDAICISVVPPSTVLHARYHCLKLRPHLPGKKIVVGLWGQTENLVNASRRVRDSGADEVVTTLADALRHLSPAGAADPAAVPLPEA